VGRVYGGGERGSEELSEACEGEPEVSREFRADLKMEVERTDLEGEGRAVVIKVGERRDVKVQKRRDYHLVRQP
jgi:hypothetical protein